MKVSSIVLSTALSAPGIIERATPIAPLVIRYLAPGWVFSKFVKWMSSHARYLKKKRVEEILNMICVR